MPLGHNQASAATACVCRENPTCSTIKNGIFSLSVEYPTRRPRIFFAMQLIHDVTFALVKGN